VNALRDRYRRVPGTLSAGVLAGVLALSSAGCGEAPGTSATGAVAPSSGVPGRFSEGGLVFDYPHQWREFHYENPSSFSSVIAYLATVDVADPCVRTPDSVSCGPGYELEPGTLVVTVENASFPGFDILDLPTGARPLVAGGLPGYVQDTDPFAQTGATAARTWSLAMPGSIDNYYRITVQVREPGIAEAFAAVDALVANLAYDPPVTPLPTGAGAAEAAARTALAALVAGDHAWACFPSSGSRRFQVTALPMGPQLAAPQVAMCSTSIEATPLQQWRMRLVERLPNKDANGAWGSDITVYVGPDGLPGMTTAAQLEQ
jgi:hypothetical protein